MTDESLVNVEVDVSKLENLLVVKGITISNNVPVLRDRESIRRIIDTLIRVFDLGLGKIDFLLIDRKKRLYEVREHLARKAYWTMTFDGNTLHYRTGRDFRMVFDDTEYYDSMLDSVVYEVERKNYELDTNNMN